MLGFVATITCGHYFLLVIIIIIVHMYIMHRERKRQHLKGAPFLNVKRRSGARYMWSVSADTMSRDDGDFFTVDM